MMKGLMDPCMSQAMVVDCVKAKAKAKATEVELREQKARKVVQENNLNLTRKLLEEAKAQTETLKKALKDKKDEIAKSKKQLH